LGETGRAIGSPLVVVLDPGCIGIAPLVVFESAGALLVSVGRAEMCAVPDVAVSTEAEGFALDLVAVALGVGSVRIEEVDAANAVGEALCCRGWTP
jgi:hypothetical protein